MAGQDTAPMFSLEELIMRDVSREYDEFKLTILSRDNDITRILRDCEHTEDGRNRLHKWLWQQYLIFKHHRLGNITHEQTFKQIRKSMRKLGKCAQCSNLGDLRCGKCKQVHYCSKECQKAHWATHKQTCTRVSN